MLPWQYRLYFWGIHGIFTEVMFTCFYDQVMLQLNPSLVGYSSAWSFLIFGLAPFLIGEPYYHFMKKRGISLPFRVFIYVLTTYVWEFVWGVLLVPWGANSWSYEQHTYNFMGIVTLEYAPFWAFASLTFEYIMSIMERLEQIPLWKRHDKQL